MAVPFAKTHAAIVEDRKDREVRAIVKQLAKALLGRQAYKTMLDFDQCMCDSRRSEAGSAFLSCLADNPLRAELIIDISEPISIVSMLRGVVPNKGGLTRVLLHMAKAHHNGSDAVVVFRVKHLGSWVAYNTADPYPCSVPRIHIPSSAQGITQVTLMPLNSYAEMWELKRGGGDNGRK